MALSRAPGVWRWEQRDNGMWWRMHDELGISEGPHLRPGFEPPSITCPECGMTSFNPHDIEHGYCGNCCEFTEGAVTEFRMANLDEDPRRPSVSP